MNGGRKGLHPNFGIFLTWTSLTLCSPFRDLFLKKRPLQNILDFFHNLRPIQNYSGGCPLKERIAGGWVDSPQTQMHSKVPKTTQKYSKLPPRNLKYPQVPSSSPKYPQVPPSTPKYRQVAHNNP